MVCCSSDVVVIAGGGDSEFDFAGYHDYATDGGYCYAVVTLTGRYDENQNQVAGGEIAEIADLLNAFGLITDDQLYQLLTGADGTRYVVEAVWSNQGRTLAAFGPAPSP